MIIKSLFYTVLLSLAIFVLPVQLYAQINVAPTVTQVSCNGGSNGAIANTLSGGTAPYTYVWSNGATTKDISGLVAGTYSVTVNDNASNTIVSSVTITEPTAITPSALGSSITCPSCNPQTNGYASVNASGGTAPYTYAWNTGSNAQTIGNLNAGTYTVTVTDNKSCMAVGTVVLSALRAIITNQSVCNAVGAATINASGGSGPYTYAWSNGAATQSISGLAAGTYTVTVTDAGNTTIAQSVAITSGALGVSNNVTICQGASTTLTASGSAVYSWSPSTGLSSSTIANPVASPTVTTTYTVSTSASSSLQLVTNGDFSAGFIGFNSDYGFIAPPYGLSMGDDNIGIATNSTDYNTNWRPITYDHTTGNGNYLIINASTIANRVIWQQTISVNPNSSYNFSAWVGSLYPVSLASMRFAINGVALSSNFTAPANAGTWAQYTATWASGSNTTATIAIYDDNLDGGGNDLALDDISFTSACSGGSAQVTVTVDTPVITTAIVPTGIICVGCTTGAAILTVSGGTSPYTYAWSNGSTSQNLSNLAAGTYNVTVSDGITCPVKDSVKIAQLVASVIGQSSCNGSNGGASLSVAGGRPPYTYLWSTGATTSSINNLPSGNYTVTITDASGLSVAQAAVINNTDIHISASANSEICLGKSTTLSASGATSYYWTPTAGLNNPSISNPIASPTVTTTYSINGSATSGELVTNEDFSLGNTGFNSEYILVTTPQPYPNGLWAEGTYVVDANPTTYHSSFTGSDHTTGTGKFMIVNGTVTAGVTIWTQTVGVTPNKTYSFATWISSMNTVNNNPASLRFSINGVLLGTSITAPNATGVWIQFSTTWNSGGATSAQISIVNQNTVANGNDYGLDDITFTTSCTSTDTAYTTVAVNAVPNATLAGTDVACFAGSNGSVATTVTSGTVPYTYLWNNGATTQNINNLAKGTYDLTVTDAKGCKDTTPIVISQPASALSSTITATNKSKVNHSDGTATLTPIGGNTPYSYAWNNSATTQNIALLDTGTYTVTITAAGGCTTTNTVTVAEPTAPCTCIATGAWKNDATWTGKCSGGGGAFAGNMDNVTIQGYQVTIDSIQIAKSLLLQENNTDTTMLLGTGTGALTVTDSINIITTGTGKDVKIALNGSSSLMSLGNMTISHNKGNNVNLLLNDQNGTAAKLYIGGNLSMTLNTGAGNITARTYGSKDSIIINGNLQLTNNINSTTNQMQVIVGAGRMIVAGNINFNPVRDGNTQVQLNGTSTLELQRDILRPAAPSQFGKLIMGANAILSLYGGDTQTLGGNTGNGIDNFAYTNISINKISGTKATFTNNIIATGLLSIVNGTLEVPASLTGIFGRIDNNANGVINVKAHGILKTQ